MPKAKPSVAAFIAALDHPLKPLIERVRVIALGANAGITEQIKWNAPSFCYGDDDRVTLRLHPTDQLQLVFHRGAKVRAADGFSFEDESGLLRWVAADRATVTFRTLDEVAENEAALARLIDRWVVATTP